MNSIFFINDFDYFYSHRFLLLKELNKCIKVGVACDASLASEDALKNCKRSNVQIIHVKNTAKDGLLGKLIQCKSQLNVVKNLILKMFYLSHLKVLSLECSYHY